MTLLTSVFWYYRILYSVFGMMNTCNLAARIIILVTKFYGWIIFTFHLAYSILYPMTLRVPDILGNTVTFSDNIIDFLLY